MSQAAYARRRGVSRASVSKAIRDGRLVDSLVVVGRAKKIADAELADREWSANTRPSASRQPDAGADQAAAELELDGAGYPVGLDYAEARRRREIETWRQAAIKTAGDELDLAQRRGEVVEVGKIRDEVEAKYLIIKAKLLALPQRIGRRLGNLDAAAVKLIDDLVREALEDLAGNA